MGAWDQRYERSPREIGLAKLHSPKPKNGTCATCKFWSRGGIATVPTCHNTEAGLGAHLQRSGYSAICAYFE